MVENGAEANAIFDKTLGEKEKISHDYDKVSVRLPIEGSKEILNLAKY